MKYLFIMKFNQSTPNALDPKKKQDVLEWLGELVDKFKKPESGYLLVDPPTYDGTETGYIGVVDLEPTEAATLFEDIRVITAVLNGFDSLRASDLNVQVGDTITRDPFPHSDEIEMRDQDEEDQKGGYGAGGSTANKAIWAKISFEHLWECFTYFGRPWTNRDTNDYYIVSPKLDQYLKDPNRGGGKITRETIGGHKDPKKKYRTADDIGLLGGIGGLGGEP